VKATETGPKVLTLTLAIPLRKGSGLASCDGITAESKTLWIQDSTPTALNSLKEGWLRQLDPGYAHILALRH
jgi:hypothetical protein